MRCRIVTTNSRVLAQSDVRQQLKFENQIQIPAHWKFITFYGIDRQQVKKNYNEPAKYQIHLTKYKIGFINGIYNVVVEI